MNIKGLIIVFGVPIVITGMIWFSIIAPKDKEITRLKAELVQKEEKLRPEITELSTLLEIRNILKSCSDEADRMIREEKPND